MRALPLPLSDLGLESAEASGSEGDAATSPAHGDRGSIVVQHELPVTGKKKHTKGRKSSLKSDKLHGPIGRNKNESAPKPQLGPEELLGRQVSFSLEGYLTPQIYAVLRNLERGDPKILR